MASEFKFIAIEIPRNITMEFVQEAKQRILDITVQEAEVLNAALDLDVSEVEISTLSEEDLFHVGQDSLKTKKAITMFLDEALNTMVVPRINAGVRVGTAINDRSFAYLEIENKLYIASGEADSYYSSRSNTSYLYLLALNMSGILKCNIV